MTFSNNSTALLREKAQYFEKSFEYKIQFHFTSIVDAREFTSDTMQACVQLQSPLVFGTADKGLLLKHDKKLGAFVLPY